MEQLKMIETSFQGWHVQKNELNKIGHGDYAKGAAI